MTEAEPTPVRHTLAAVSLGVDRLLEALDDIGLSGLPGLDTGEVLRLAADVERLRNRLCTTDRPLVAELDRRGAAEERMMRSTAHLLADTLRLTRSEASQRVDAARSLSPRVLPTGGTEPPRYPVLAGAQADGTVSPEQVRVIIRGLQSVDRLIGLRPGEDAEPVGPEDVVRAEQELCRHARVFDPRELAACADRIVDVLDPDGHPDRQEAQQRRRRLTLREQPDGMWRLHADLLPETGLALRTVLRPLARPRRDDPGDHPFETEDLRTPEQREHDALADVVGRVQRAGGLPVAGGVPTTVILTIDEASLRARVGHAWTTTGARLPITTVLRMADQAEIIPTVSSSTGAVLWQGRTKRIATLPQTLALYGRDGGCTFPGCDQAPDWCERHHIVGWEHGGETNLDNLTLLCRYHHHRFEQHGWTCRMIDGLPHWTAPPHLDPDQTPLLHHRLQRLRERRQAQHAQLQDALPETPEPDDFVPVPAHWDDFAPASP